ncbi:uncharacterized protein [Dendrobates tinctorius]|uniref:uncharacterized protein n=1 Tax=Dendrobates tinctorius TaxID=92724 RepID=UPI003CC98F2B
MILSRLVAWAFDVFCWYFYLQLIISVFFTAFKASSNMDYKAREQTWLTQLNDVFCDDPGVLPMGNGRDKQDIFNKLKDVLNKRMRTWWNRAFLNKYLEKGLIPRGLRVQVFPSFEVDDLTFRQKWEDLATTCSRGFMELLVSNNQTTLENLDKDIVELQNQLKQDLSNEGLVKFNTELENEFVKWEKNICENKSKKFQRDISDQQSNMVYRWNKKPYHARGPSRARSASTISVTSSEGSNRSHPKYYDLRNSGFNRERQATKCKTSQVNQQNKKKRRVWSYKRFTPLLKEINLEKIT